MEPRDDVPPRYTNIAAGKNSVPYFGYLGN